MASAVMYATRSTADTQPGMRRIIEQAGQTFLIGVPVMLNATTGAVQEWDGTTIANGIAGISKDYGANLTTTGVPKTLTYGIVQNQPLAVNIPAGAPINDGRSGFEAAIPSTIFYGQVGPSQTAVAADLAVPGYGMTKDTDGHWYVDKSKVTMGTNTVCRIVKLGGPGTPGSTPWDPRSVQFVFLFAAELNEP